MPSGAPCARTTSLRRNSPGRNSPGRNSPGRSRRRPGVPSGCGTLPATREALTGWTGKLLITCRRPCTLDTPGQARLAFRRLGPLTRSGAAELTTSLPAIRLLGEAERDQVWRLTAGHPLAMEYLDLLLARGERYPDLAGRVEAAIRARTGQPLPRTEPTELPEPTPQPIPSPAAAQMSAALFYRLTPR